MNFDVVISDYPAMRLGVGNKVLCKWGLGVKALDKYDAGLAAFSEHDVKRLVDDFPTLCPNGRIVRRGNYIRLVPDGCRCIGTLLVYVYLLSKGYGIDVLPDVANDDFTQLICEFLKLVVVMHDVLGHGLDCAGALYAVGDLVDEMMGIVSK